jgi:hypothetical protein
LVPGLVGRFFRILTARRYNGAVPAVLALELQGGMEDVKHPEPVLQYLLDRLDPCHVPFA